MKDLTKIKAIISDVDGVLTDGQIRMMRDNELMVFSSKDGIGFRMAHLAGLKTAWITGRGNEILLARAKRLWIDEVVMECMDKEKEAEKLLEKWGITWDEVLAIGDDVIDLPLIEKAYFGVVPSDALDIVKKSADFVSEFEGGKGVARQVIDMVLNAKGIFWETFEKLKER